jgi:excisionase family DNA binding protein
VLPDAPERALSPRRTVFKLYPIPVDTADTDQRDRKGVGDVATPERRDYSTDEPYITTGDVAKLLRVSPKTVARWAKEGRLPHIVTLGGHRRFPAGAIEELARSLRVVT